MTTPLDISTFVYQTGTLNISPGDTTAVFSGSALATSVKDGDYLFAGGSLAVIETVTDDTHAELFTEWAGSSVTAGPYLILKASLLRYHTALIGYDSASFLALLDGTTVWYAVEGDEPDPSIGEDNQRALKTNVTPWKQWLKTGGVWVEQAGSPGGPGATILVQDAEPDTSHPDNSLWIDSDSTDLDVYALTGSPPAWTDTGMNLKGATGPASWAPPTAWVTGTAYVAAPPASAVTQGGETYVCLIAHTSGSFSTDLAAGKWIKVAAKGADGTGVGDVVGPSSAVDSHIALFDTISGKAIKDSGKAVSDFATAAQGTKADSAVQDIAAVTHAATSKTTPVDADEFALVDSAASNVLKKLTWANLRAFFATASQGVKADSALQGAFGFRNRIINPGGQIWQRVNSGAAAITDVTYCFDRWYGLTQSAGVTASQVSNAANGTPYMMRLSQANATAQRLGIAQAIESANCIDMRGQAVTLSAQVRMSAATTLRYAIVEWTGTADAVTKDVVNDWTNGTFTAGSFFISATTTITATGSVALAANTLTPINLTGTVSGSMNNIIVFFWTDSTQAQNVTLDIGKVQLELGSSATQSAVRSYQQEIQLCLRYYWRNFPAATSAPFGSGVAVDSATAGICVTYPVTMRSVPTLGTSSASNLAVLTIGSFSVSAISTPAASNINMTVVATSSGLTAGHGAVLRTANTSGDLVFNAEL